jgi:HlyD family secretion protein
VLPAGTDGTPVAIAVVPGISDGHMTEIVSGDLKEGMLVVTGQKATVSP